LVRETALDSSCLSGGWIMPLLRYFTVVGGALLVLLLVVSSYFPETEAVNHSDAARPVIRAASDRVGPPRVTLIPVCKRRLFHVDSGVLQQAPSRDAKPSLAHRSDTCCSGQDRAQKDEGRKAARPPENGRQSTRISAFPFSLVTAQR